MCCRLQRSNFPESNLELKVERRESNRESAIGNRRRQIFSEASRRRVVLLFRIFVFFVWPCRCRKIFRLDGDSGGLEKRRGEERSGETPPRNSSGNTTRQQKCHRTHSHHSRWKSQESTIFPASFLTF